MLPRDFALRDCGRNEPLDAWLYFLMTLQQLLQQGFAKLIVTTIHLTGLPFSSRGKRSLSPRSDCNGWLGSDIT